MMVVRCRLFAVWIYLGGTVYVAAFLLSLTTKLSLLSSSVLRFHRTGVVIAKLLCHFRPFSRHEGAKPVPGAALCGTEQPDFRQLQCRLRKFE
jgi:hypothetical protein